MRKGIGLIALVLVGAIVFTACGGAPETSESPSESMGALVDVEPSATAIATEETEDAPTDPPTVTPSTRMIEGTYKGLHFIQGDDWIRDDGSTDDYDLIYFSTPDTVDNGEGFIISSKATTQEATDYLLAQDAETQLELMKDLMIALNGSSTIITADAPLDPLPTGTVAGFIFDGEYEGQELRGMFLSSNDRVYSIQYMVADRENSPYTELWPEIAAQLYIGAPEESDMQFASEEPIADDAAKAALTEMQQMLSESPGWSEWGVRTWLSLDLSDGQIQYVIDNLDVDWVAQARASAEAYNSFTPQTREQMEDLLINDGYTVDQIEPVLAELYD